MINDSLLQRLMTGISEGLRRENACRREETAIHGQHPWAIVICCSDSRVIPERIFHSEIGELFVIRVAGNVLDNHQIGSVEYAAAHLHCKLVIVLGHTQCGAIGAALSGESDGFIRYITDEINEAIGEEKDPVLACEKNVLHAVSRLQMEFSDHEEAGEAQIVGAVYDIFTGEVRFLN